MTKDERELAATLLDMASDAFSTRGYNNFNLKSAIRKRVVRDEIVRSCLGDEYEENSGLDEARGVDYRVPDWLLMSALATRLRSEG